MGDGERIHVARVEAGPSCRRVRRGLARSPGEERAGTRRRSVACARRLPGLTRGRHYQAPNLAQLANAVGTIRIALPGAPVVASSAPPSTPESSNESFNGSGVGEHQADA